MTNFNFNSLANTSFVNEGVQYLKPYDIYPVNLTKIERTELKGKDGTSTYQIVALEFTGIGDNKGVFSHNLFVPVTERDFERQENETSHKEMPSRFEQYQYTLMQIVEALNPAGAQKIKDNASKLKTVEDFTNLVIKALASKNTVKAFLKLTGRNSNGKIYATIPNPCLIGNDGNLVPLNFINTDESKLFFSNYEIGQKKLYNNAKPTEMTDNDPDSKEEELDLDNIEI